jgi:hypothetical protein
VSSRQVFEFRAAFRITTRALHPFVLCGFRSSLSASFGLSGGALGGYGSGDLGGSLLTICLQLFLKLGNQALPCMQGGFEGPELFDYIQAGSVGFNQEWDVFVLSD